ncbi:MAG: sugar phosphate permease [candidate division NC10 bacterium]|jgi:FSR family fosmidomycin resistance protein-like MFS transporter|nr:sugar phosphate permease [candidate division NC10 bacterium]
MRHRTVVLLSLGHLVTDINQGALPALLPFFITEYHLSYAAAGFLIFACNIASTVVQPLFGHLADRRPNAWLLPAGIASAGAGLAVTGLVPGYAWACAAVMVSGIGVAAFHPQGARFVNRVAGERKATAMSVFGVGGTLGFAIGPGLVTAALLHWGLPGTVILALPTTLLAALLARHLAATPISVGGSTPHHTGGSSTEARDAWGPFARLAAAVVARAVLFFGFNTFVPLYWIHVLGQSKAAGATALTVFALAGVAGNLLGGQLADRFGPTRIAVVGFCILLPLAPALMVVTSVSAALVALALIGFALSTTYSPLVILGQAYLPNHMGLSAGVTLGIAISIGGVATPILGSIADHYGLWTTLAVLSVVPLASAVLALTLPPPHRLRLQPSTQT